MRHLIAYFIFFVTTPCWALYDEEHMESGMLYRVAINRGRSKLFICVHSQSAQNELIEGFQRITEILLLASDGHHVLQRIQPQGGLDARDIEYGDFNWDGYRDFRIYDRGPSGKGCRIYFNYLFHPETQRYSSCKALDHLCTVCFDDEDKTIHTYPHAGQSDYVFGTYRWRGARLLLISQVCCNHDSKGRFFREYSDRRADDTFRVRRFYYP